MVSAKIKKQLLAESIKSRDLQRPIAPPTFGIPQLDELLGYRRISPLKPIEPGGDKLKDTLHAQSSLETGDLYDSLYSRTSLTLVGEDGTGKSVFSLHLAAAYAALHYRALESGHPNPALANTPPLILYASSDLRHEAARTVWDNFYLDTPWLRYIPSIGEEERGFRIREVDKLLGRSGEGAPYLNVKLVSKRPGEVATHLSARMKQHVSRDYDVFFIDLAKESTGDDWRYISNLLASFPRHIAKDGTASQPPHLLIVDSVAGFEALIGRTNSFGEETSRRSRVSQLLKAAGNSWHVVFVVEEPEGVKHHPEEYVTDTVIHLRRSGTQEKVRRFVEIEKSRARTFAQGEHQFEIRDGMGSSTRSWENPDDPRVLLHPNVRLKLRELERIHNEYNAYIQVFPSLNYLSKQFAGRHFLPSTSKQYDLNRRIPFKIQYLDSMLKTGSSSPEGGLRPGTITAMIGEEGTTKVYLAEEFLVAAYDELPAVVDLFISLSVGYRKAARLRSFESYIKANAARVVDGIRVNYKDTEVDWDRLEQNLSPLGANAYDLKTLNDIATENCKLKEPEGGAAPLKPRWSLRDYLAPSSDAEEAALALAFSALRISTGTLSPTVFVATHDSSREALAERVIHRHRKRLEEIFSKFFVNASSPIAEEERKRTFLARVCDSLQRVLENWIIVRRVELVDSTAPQLWHTIEGAVIQGMTRLGHRASAIITDPYPKAFTEGVRVVISDLRLLRDTYPAVAADPLFLPTLVFRLRRFGVTTIIVESENGRLNQPPSHPMSGALRSLADHQINTWKVNFFGEQRVAIAVLPSTGASGACLIRELRFAKELPSNHIHGAPDKSLRLIVDPLFEVFENIEEGNPTAVQLQVHLYDETPAFREYATREQNAFNLIFSPEAQMEPGVLRIVASADYRALRDYIHLPVNRKLPFSMVMMVDGYWALGRRNALRNQHSYLFAPLPEEGETRFEDPFRLFIGERLGSEPLRRCDLFKQVMKDGSSVYAHRISPDFAEIDRVPFTWDFGFLLCNEDQWIRAKKSRLRAKFPSKEEGPLVKDIFNRMNAPTKLGRNHLISPYLPQSSEPVSWRDFFEACFLVASTEQKRTQETCRPFDVATSSPDSLTCLIFEIWFSEIFHDMIRLAGFVNRYCGASEPMPALCKEMSDWIDKALAFLLPMSSEFYSPARYSQTTLQSAIREWNVISAERSVKRSLKRYQSFVDDHWKGKPGSDADGKDISTLRRFCLLKTAGGYSLHLYQTWLLLLEVLDFKSFTNDAAPFELARDRVPDSSAAAVRHWYKTACAASKADLESVSLGEAMRVRVPVRLPGHFSVRGDWFLAASEGSRSGRLSEQAIDLLSSRRANRTRLHLGLGLPVRDLISGDEIKMIRTALNIATQSELHPVTYGDMLEMGGSFISGLPELERERIILSERGFFWLFRTGLCHYDRQAVVVFRWLQRMFAWTVQYRFEHADRWSGGFEAYDMLSHGDLSKVQNFDSWKTFFGHLRIFEADLDACTQTAEKDNFDGR